MKTYDLLVNLEGFCPGNSLLEYCNFIDKHLDSPKITYKTNRHHIIPCCYYEKFIEGEYNRSKLEELASIDPNNRLVNLSFSDHIYAHWLLTHCTNGLLRNKLVCAYIRMTKSPFYSDIEPTELQLAEYQKLYEEYKIYNNHFKGKHHSAEWCAQHSADMKGKVTYIRTPEIKKKISDTLRENNKLGKYTISKEGLAKKRHPGSTNGMYGKHPLHITDNVIDKIVFSTNDIPQGFHLGTPINIRPVYQLDLNDNFIQVFLNPREAAKYLNKDVSMIAVVCNGKYKTAYNSKWGYINITASEIDYIKKLIQGKSLDNANSYLEKLYKNMR